MHFLITGGAGFIGSHVTEQLLLEGYRVTVVDNLITGNFANLPDHPSLKFIYTDISDCNQDDFQDRIDGVAHLAATPSVAKSWINPLDVHNNNLSNTISVIELCQSLNISKLVFASSAAVYGSQSDIPISEDRSTQPVSPYGLQKLVSEQYASLFAQEIGFSFVALRLFNVFGPRQLPNSQYSGVISNFLNVMQNNKPIIIYGDGNQTRDFIYVKDVATAITRALTSPLTLGSSRICNIGSGKSTSIRQLVSILKTYFPQWEEKINFAPSRIGDIQQSQADISKVLKLLDFKPMYSVESGLSDFLKSWKDETN